MQLGVRWVDGVVFVLMGRSCMEVPAELFTLMLWDPRVFFGDGRVVKEGCV